MIRRLALVAMMGWLAACQPRLLPEGPLAATPRQAAIEDGALLTTDGLALPVRSWLPEAGPPAAVIVALHGFNDYSNAFAAPGQWLAGQRIAVYAYDQRGFGRSPHAGLWPGTAKLAGDLRAMVDVVRRRHPGRPLYVMGESMGGGVAMVAAAGPEPDDRKTCDRKTGGHKTGGRGLDIDGLILVGAAVRGRAVLPAWQEAALWLAAHLFPSLRLGGRGLNITPSDNTGMLRALSGDPLVIKKPRADALWGIVDLMDDALAATAALDLPVLLLYGLQDDIIPPAATRAMLARLPRDAPAPVTILYPDGYHMLLRDVQAEVVWRDIAHWIASPDTPPPSGLATDDPLAVLAR